MTEIPGFNGNGPVSRRPKSGALRDYILRDGLRLGGQDVTPHMVRRRTVELVISAGLSSIEIRQRDYEQEERELAGETDFNYQQAVLYGW